MYKDDRTRLHVMLETAREALHFSDRKTRQDLNSYRLLADALVVWQCHISKLAYASIFEALNQRATEYDIAELLTKSISGLPRTKRRSLALRLVNTYANHAASR